MRNKHIRTLEAIFEEPVRSNVSWADIEALLDALGAELSSGRGSRVRVVLHDAKAVFHRPHPDPNTDKGALKSVRKFLISAGVTPDSVEETEGLEDDQ